VPCDCSNVIPWGTWFPESPTNCPRDVDTKQSTSEDNGYNNCKPVTCYQCKETECCLTEIPLSPRKDAIPWCSWYCPNSVCDNDPGDKTPDGGPCCDDECIDCGDCGEGGQECCNSVPIQSLFDPLSGEPEKLPLDQFIFDLESYNNPQIVHFVMHNKNGLSQEQVKFSILYRAYLLDALAEIDGGAEMYPTLLKHHREWQKQVNASRALQFPSGPA
jgi:hypothetical protein